MRIGINFTPEHQSPEDWAEQIVSRGWNTASFPVDYTAPLQLIDEYVKAAKEHDILIAEVGVWDSPFLPDKEKAEKVMQRMEEQFRLADYVQACCCVNVSGAAGSFWAGCYAENFTKELYERNVELMQHLCDTVKPQHTCYTLEPMQWMVPDSPEQYLQLVKDVNREHFAVHMDIVNFIKDPYTYTHMQEMIDRSFRQLGPYIRSCHLKDCRLADGTTVVIQEVPMGEGEMENAAYLKAISELDREVPVLLEHLPKIEDYEKAFAQVKRIFPQIG